MMKMFTFAFIGLVISAFILVGCKQKQELNSETAGKTDLLNFKNEKYGFSFSYTSGLEGVSRDLPEKWALLDKNKNIILFVVNKAQTKNLLSLGRTQALKDLYNGNNISDLKIDVAKKIIQTVKLDSFNNRTWYTYGIKFSDKKVDTLISGTLCKDNEIMLVMVSDYSSFEKNREIYTKMLNTFEC